MKYIYSLPQESGFKGKRITVNVDVLQNSKGKNFLHETATVSNAVAVLAVNHKDEFVLLKIPRHSVKEPELLEIPAGKIDDIDKLKGGSYDTELEAAKRELQEETGYTAAKWELAGTFYPSPGWASEKITLFIATDLNSGKKNLEETEEGIKTVLIKKDKAVSLINNGSIKDLKTAYLIKSYLLQKGEFYA